jgi:acetyl-CoA/propionyl-CoA carboxylase, biotin carboxylase, biotin carboxyl carrier protein
MNTRVQVEHCVTEMVTGIDIVREQVRIAAGEGLSVAQNEVEMRGHAIECRINAEAAHKNFAPAPGRIERYIEPAGPGVRVDSGLEAGSEVTPLYDPMVAKLIVWDSDRERATRRMLRALGEYEIEPLVTLIPFHRALLATEQWAKGETCRDLTEDRAWLKDLAPEPAPEPTPQAASGMGDSSSARGAGASAPDAGEPAELAERTYKVEVDGKLHSVKVIGAAPPAGNSGPPASGARRPPRREGGGGAAGASSSSASLASPLQGTVLRVAVEQGSEVEEGALICVIEAMKMENEITAHRSGKLIELNISEGAGVSAGDEIARIE